MSFLDWLIGKHPEEEGPFAPGDAGVRLACLTDRGLRRSVNEDNFSFNGTYMPREHETLEEILTVDVSLSDHFRAGLFDGMGGESAGDLASFTAAEQFSRLAGDGVWDETAAAELLRALNRAVLAEADRQQISLMGATAVIAQWNDEEVIAAGLGDSPVFLYRGGSMKLLTEADNSEGRFSQAGDMGRKPGLTQFLGLPEENGDVQPHVVRFVPAIGDVCLLCTDGLTDMVPQDDIRRVLAGASDAEETAEIAEAADKLRKLALDGGGRDNITIILAQIYNRQ